MPSHAENEVPKRTQSKWSPEEDALIIRLRGRNMKRSEWDEERKNKLARLYERFKPEMWAKVAEEMAVPWRAAEAIHWQLGEADMARRAGVMPFRLAGVNVQGKGSHRNWPSHSHIHLQPQRSMPCDSGVPSPQILYHGARLLPTNTRTMASCQGFISSPPPFPDSSRVRYVPRPGPALIQNQPLPRTDGTLPGVEGLIQGIRPYSAHAAVPDTGPITGVAQSTRYATPATHSFESAGSKRRASPDQFSYKAPKLCRISQGLLSS
ncbi:hypothetical protein IWW34DRAFT_812432 [Fusarium oxysporum f. sp. albedinis]|nr:hypothetical protein IWW34DRAFT_812432 [Fusarium oxysporum f. sp. albedinis]